VSRPKIIVASALAVALVAGLALSLIRGGGNGSAQPSAAGDHSQFFGIVQGPTLAPLLHRLHLSAGESDEAEESHARLAIAEAGLNALDDPKIAASPYPEVVRYLRKRHLQRARRWAAEESALHDEDTGDIAHHHLVHAPSHAAGALDERRAAEYRRVRSAMLDAEQAAVLKLRDDGVLADDIMRRIQRDLDLETLLLETSEPVRDSAGDIP